MRNIGFPPIIGHNPKILILGTFPGKESLRKNQYYAHSQNGFWHILCKLLKISPESSYEQKKEALIKNKIALWDVLKACERDGSSDQAIKHHTIQVNDFNNLFTRYPSIKFIFFNGARAEMEYRKRVIPTLNNHQNHKYCKLPSTSPAMASLTREQKYRRWAEIISGGERGI